jgi:NADP-reducing hydrogenase subunit HndD
MVAALRALGFDYVFDTDFAADLTIMEEGTELLGRLERHLEGDKQQGFQCLHHAARAG